LRKEQPMQWVTRARPKVDRVACPWLIKRFVDPEAEFIYVPAEEVMTFAAPTGAIPYDVPNVELGHHGPECAFDAILKTNKVTDPALQRLAPIVRGADTADKDLTPESRGLEAIADGFRRLYDDDHERLTAEWVVYDALYTYCQALVASDVVPHQERDPSMPDTDRRWFVVIQPRSCHAEVFRTQENAR
jgi:hypothetical protein